MFTCLLRGRSTPEIRAIFSPLKSSIGLQPGLAVFPIAFSMCYKFVPAKLLKTCLSILAIGNSGNLNLSLSLFMFRILADHAHHAFTMHDLALIANLLD
jgi:hypothetical protein